MSVRPAKTQISLGIRPGWSESSLCAQWVAKDPSFLQVGSENSDQIGRMPRLIWARLGWCPGWSESSLGAQSLCWFCYVAAHKCPDQVNSIYDTPNEFIKGGIKQINPSANLEIWILYVNYLVDVTRQKRQFGFLREIPSPKEHPMFSSKLP